MKLKLLLTIAGLMATFGAFSQERSVFRSGYLRLGINQLGKALDNNLSPKGNIFNNRYGAGTGYVLEFGHIYYFKSKKKETQLNYGLDWTILSLNYNKMDEWGAYAKSSQAGKAEIEGESIAAAISSKLGPTLSIIPFKNSLSIYVFR
ncbi:hypothetical protein [Pedobacter rhizosphaerae]|uniref:Outer membrane protein beta-barrel domain-containing protein n=1 Tax=Pedobacter rhizosphaerae TaxID=390241 RepID=A0A1H9SKD5_9SPHI|nr:hypothetical protein [Pedobacter rhizosphaerae]SER85358.1 hypothetical protein SAMN04488023_11866 [Pedobacter rhizosphaerae]